MLDSDKIISDLNKLNIKEFKDMKIGNILMEFLYSTQNAHRSLRNIIKSFILIILRTVHRRNIYTKDGKAGPLFYCSPAMSNRDDHFRNFKNITNLSESKLVVWMDRKPSITFRHIVYLPIILRWNSSIRRIVINGRLRWMIIQALFDAYIDFVEILYIMKIEKFKTEMLISMEDMTPSPYMIAYYFNNNNIKTVSLQHGVYAHSEILSKKVALFPSHYLITYSQYTKEQIELCKTYKNKMIIGGLVHFINNSIKVRDIKVIKRIGVFLEPRGYFTEFNIKLLKISEDVAGKIDAKLIIKQHPSDGKKRIFDYENAIKNKDIVYSWYCKEKSSIEVESEIDAFVCVASTCFAESVYQMIPSFLLYDNSSDHIYTGIDFDIYFKNADDLLRLIKGFDTKNSRAKRAELKKYICGYDDPSSQYKVIIEGLLR